MLRGDFFCLVRFLVVCFLRKTNPDPRKIKLLWEKRGPNATFNLVFLGLGWPWVGEIRRFGKIIFPCFPTQQNLVNRKYPYVTHDDHNDDVLALLIAQFP